MIIGISGNNGSGKDTFGMMLQAELERQGHRVKRTAFAKPLYFICAYLYCIETKAYYDAHPEHKSNIAVGDLTVRDLLNQVGAKIREVYPNTWVNFVRSEHRDGITIVTDVRFESEASICDVMYEVIRDGHDDNIPDAFHAGTLIHNNGSLDDLAMKAKEIVSTIGK